MALSDSLRNRRLLANAVGMLLAGNVVALFVVGDGGTTAGGPLDGPAPAGASEEGAPETITLVTNADGTRFVVDASTPEGRAIIDRAVENGGTVSTAPAPSTTTTTAKKKATTTTAPAAKGSRSPVSIPAEVGDVLDDTRTTVTSIARDAADLLDQVGDTVDGAVDDATDLVPGSTDDGTVDPAVDGLTDTVGGTVDTVVGATEDAGDVVGGLTGQSSSGSSAGGLLNGLVSEVEQTVSNAGGGGLL